MASRASRVLGVLIGLLLAGVVGWLLRATLTPVAGGVVVRVGPKAAQVVQETAYLSRGNNDVAFWVVVDANGKVDRTKTLSIEFEDRDVFEAVTQDPTSHRYRVTCQGWTCSSGDISPTAVYDKKYKYWQVITDSATPPTRDVADGHIIIQK
jgi:hypothetical protein